MVTPRIQVIDVNKDGYPDIVISSPDFAGANPVLYNQGNGTFSWQEPERKG